MSATTTREAETTRSRPPAPVRPRTFSRRQKIVITVVNLALFCVAWELVARLSGVPSLLVPTFSAVVGEFFAMRQEGILWANLWISLQIYLVGMALSILAAIPFGLLVGGIKILDRIVGPYVWALYTLPRLILMPLILLWVGINDTARVLLVVLSAGPAIIVVIMDAMKTIEPSLVRAARSFCAGRRQVFTHVALPSTVPYIATAVRMGVSRGLIGLFIGELFTAADGIGYVMVLAGRQFNSARVYFILLVFVAFSVALVGLTQWLEKKASIWRSA
ncbi:MAG: ABC transporter permease subunit [Streptosporangiales bacterium]|nr:ABC transporter permease subunit [Streptosporangiales bacterium]